MQTIEFTIDETLLAKLDQITGKLSVTRSAFIRQSLEAALQQQEVLAQERRHAEGYACYPVQPGEFDEWENVRVWESLYDETKHEIFNIGGSNYENKP